MFNEPTHSPARAGIVRQKEGKMLIAGLKGCAMGMLIGGVLGAILGAIVFSVYGLLFAQAFQTPAGLALLVTIPGIFFGAIVCAVLGAPVGAVAGWAIYWVRSHEPTEGSASR